MTCGAKDRVLLRELARAVAERAADPVMEERRRLWKSHNSLQPARPLLLVFPEGAWCELLPDEALQCESEEARRIEWGLRSRLYYRDHLDDDTVIEADWPVGKRVHHTGWGLEARHKASSSQRGAWAFDPVIHGPEDLKKIAAPEVSVDEEGSARDLAVYQELFGDLLRVRQVGIAHVSFHLMKQFTDWRGLGEAMMDMVTEPGLVHEAMARLRDAHQERIRQYVDLNLLTLNNDGSYHSSGGNGYTDELPAEGFDPGRPRPRDLWASAEAQELAQVSPEMHRTFAMAYERPLLEPFGLNGYGCCEDLTRKLPDVFDLPRMRRISISPFADVEACAAQLANRYIFSWKPQPAHLVGAFDEARVRAYLQHALRAARGCVLEIILKDTHTCEGHPERFDRWTRIARDLVEQAAAGWNDGTPPGASRTDPNVEPTCPHES